MNEGLLIANLSAGYGGTPVLSGLSLPLIPPGTTVGVLGPNAAGKSTLLKALAGLRPATGDLLLDDQPLHRTIGTCPAHIGYLPQTLPQASGLLAYELVLAACRVGIAPRRDEDAPARVEATLRQLGLESFALRPLGELSGGKRQLVGMAQVLGRRPRLLLLDEPTSALDLRWQLELLEHVRAHVRRERAIALVALHDLNLAARFCDRLVLLAGGQILADGDAATVLTPERIARAYGIEARVESCSLGVPLVVAVRPQP